MADNEQRQVISVLQSEIRRTLPTLRRAELLRQEGRKKEEGRKRA